MQGLKRIAALMMAVITFGAGQAAYASIIGSPMALRGVIEQIHFSEPTLAPMAYTMFCLRYSTECTPPQQKIVFRGGSVRMTKERMAELIEVIASVNRHIVPQYNDMGLAGEEWLIGLSHADCNDYVVTKRHELLARGWPMRTCC